MAVARTPTLLSLDRYAQIMGINPAHFNQAAGSTYMPINNSCANIWYQEDWMNADQVGRESLALEIHNAEMDIANALGWFPAPTWIAQDLKAFPRHYRPDAIRVGTWDVRGYTVGLRAQYGKVISPGIRSMELVGTATTAAGTLVYSDSDGDGLTETATIILATALTDETEIKAYYINGNEPEWEIRPPRTKTLSGGVLTMTFWVWQLISPDLWNAIPTTAGTGAIDITDTTAFETRVSVYREYNDYTQASAVFMWEGLSGIAGSVCSCCGGTGCPACQLTTQDGCLHVRDGNLGLVVPVPATYNATDGQWEADAYSCDRSPDSVSLNYYCGAYDDRFLAGRTLEPLSDYWATTIAWLATARLERPFCNCGALVALAEELREDLALSTSGRSHSVSFRRLDNPFGTRRGEVKAWERVHRTRGQLTSVGLA